MAVTGKDQFSQGDIVLICDLSSSQGQNPHPVVGRIKEFLDPLHAQAVIAYGAGRTVDRPLQLLVKLVSAEEQERNKEGILFDPFIQEDLAVEEERQEGDVRPPGLELVRLREQQQQQDGGVRPGGPPRPAPAQQKRGGGSSGDDGGEHTVGQAVLEENAYGGEHGVQEGDGGGAGEDAGVASEHGDLHAGVAVGPQGQPGDPDLRHPAQAGQNGDADDGSKADDGTEIADGGSENADDSSEIASGDKEEKEGKEEKRHGANTGVTGVIANQGWQGGRNPRTRKKLNKF